MFIRSWSTNWPRVTRMQEELAAFVTPFAEHSVRHQRHNSTSFTDAPQSLGLPFLHSSLRFAQASHDISFHLPFYIFLTSYDNLFPFILRLCSNVFPGFLFLFCSPSSFLKDGHIQWMCGDYGPCRMNVPMAERSLGLERSHSLSLFHFQSIFAGASSSSTDALVGDGDKSGRVRDEGGWGK